MPDGSTGEAPEHNGTQVDDSRRSVHVGLSGKGMAQMRFHLRDVNTTLADAWRQQFKLRSEVEVSSGDIFEAGPHHAIVSPANSFGFMDGGIDLVYSRRFGWDLQRRLQDEINEQYEGELPVGMAAIVETGDPDFPWLVSAPTMRVPTSVADTVNAYLAFRAAILAVRRHNEVHGSSIESVLCPGLGTAVGRMPESRCAYQMHTALLAVSGEIPSPALLGLPRELHLSMLTA